jgi:hyperosmotically inducible protein
MRRMTTSARIAGAALAVAVTVACSERTEREAEAVAKDGQNAAERAGSATAEAGRDAGNAVTDAARATGDAVMNGGKAADAAVETLDVKTALTADTRVDASNINVDSDHTAKTVTLKGRVPTAAQKTLAEEIATAKATGYRVRNELVVGTN